MTLKGTTNQFRLKVDIALFLQIADDHLKRYWVKSLHNLFIHLRNRTLWPNVRFDTLLKGSCDAWIKAIFWLPRTLLAISVTLGMTSLTTETKVQG